MVTGGDRATTSSLPAYGKTGRTLHWLTVVALVAQFVVGYVMDAGGSGRGRGRGRGRSGESGRGRGRGGDLDVFDDTLVTIHVVLGVAVLVLAAGRLWWRRRRGLPPWAPQLSPMERRVAHWTERVLYSLLFAVPATGLWLVFVSDDALWLHVVSHVLLYAAIAAHLALILRHQLVLRNGLVRRML